MQEAPAAMLPAPQRPQQKQQLPQQLPRLQLNQHHLCDTSPRLVRPSL